MFDCLVEKKKDYSKAVIYKISCKDISVPFVYIGSSINFKMRLAHHKSDYFNVLSPRYKLGLYEFMRANGDWHNFVIVIVEEFSCGSKRELEEREQYWKGVYGDNIGKNRAHITKEQIKEQAHEAYIKNREVRLQKAKAYYEKNKEHKRKYYEDNKERILERSKKRYEEQRAGVGNYVNIPPKP